jgi:hypothetical protein
LLLARDGGKDIGTMLVVNQFIAAVIASKPRDFPSAMLADSTRQVIGHADVEHGMMFVRHDVDPAVVVPRHEEIFSVMSSAVETSLISLEIS